MSEAVMSGVSLVAGTTAAAKGGEFRGVNPATGEKLEPVFYAASSEDVERACRAADEAAEAFGTTSGRERAAFLRGIADELTALGEAIVARAHQETGLPLPRLQGELGRTTGQLKLFAEVAEEGSWVDARIDEALPDRAPLPRPDIRSMLRPLGPVAVFGASNFPLAFSVAGGDTASALAAGCPVVVKAHPAHPGTSELAGLAITRAVAKAGLPGGVFSLLFDDGIDVGVALVKHPAIQAVGFTGSGAGGQALMKLAAARPQPIPVFAEMGSTNPLFILPGAMRERGAALAAELQGSFTLGSGQFCTKPGLVFVPGDSEGFQQALRTGVEGAAPGGMLTHGIAAKYGEGLAQRSAAAESQTVSVFASATSLPSAGAAAGQPTVFDVDLETFLAEKDLQEEIFGPTTLLVHYGRAGFDSADGMAELVAVAEQLHGHLTATLHGTPEDLAAAGSLIRVLERKVGRILVNGYPTGVEVCHAMVHGGPFPACSDAAVTSVGTRAIFRFARPVCYQNFPEAALPQELRSGNPLGIERMVNGARGRA